MKRILYFALITSSCFYLAACGKSCEEKATSNAPTIALGTSDDTFTLESDLLTRVPDESFAFFVWQGAHPAYARLLDSPWSESSSLFSLLPSSQTELTQIIELLAAAGFDPRDPKVMAKIFAEAVFFVYRGEKPEPEFGVVFKPEGQVPAAILTKIAEATKDTSYLTEEIVIAGDTGLSITVSKGEKTSPVPVGNKPEVDRKIFAIAQGDMGIIALSKKTIERVMEKEELRQPAIVKTAEFQKLTKPLPGATDRFVTGYVDIASFYGSGEDGAETSPLRALSLSSSMTDAPQMDIFLLLNDNELAKAFVPTDDVSRGDAIRAVVPSNPLFFLDVDGAALKKVKSSLVSKYGATDTEVTSNLAFIDSISRFGLAAKVAPVGQSILPIPELLFLFDSSEPEAAISQLKELVSSGLKNTPMTAGLQWSEKDVGEGKTLNTIMSPLGFGIFLASKDSLVFAASTEAAAKAVLGGTSVGAFEKSVPSKVNSLFALGSTLSSFHVDFSELSSLLGNMGGVLAMYAPQDKNAQKMLAPENVASLKKMGLLSGSLRFENDLLALKAFYSKGPKTES